MSQRDFDEEHHSFLMHPSRNKGLAFSHDERKKLGLLGHLPCAVTDIDTQIKRAYSAFHFKTTDYAKHQYLRHLRERNEVLYFTLLQHYAEELIPYVYTPVVGEAVEKYSLYPTFPRGVFLSYPFKDDLEQIIENLPHKDVDVIVMTDGGRVLGLGDMGVGGMAICIGKLDLYTMFAGIHPSKVLPIAIDVGTNNSALLDDELYVGYRNTRISSDEYYPFVDRIIKALKRKYPKALLQWEDFGKDNARTLLDKYKSSITSFNDDIQGTACSVLAGLFSAMEIIHQPLQDQNIVIYGAGSAGTGIAEAIYKSMLLEGVDEATAVSKIYMIDRHGLIQDGQEDLTPLQKQFSKPRSLVSQWKCKDELHISLTEAIYGAKASILIGVSSDAGAFDEGVVKAMSSQSERPIIMPLSNPTKQSEAHPKDLMQWTNGKALVATGSPFQPVQIGQTTHRIPQCNNVYIFPGLGLGIISVRAKKVSDEMLLVAAKTLGQWTSSMEKGVMFPKLSSLREISLKVAVEVAKKAIEQDLATIKTPSNLENHIEKNMWFPRYAIY